MREAAGRAPVTKHCLAIQGSAYSVDWRGGLFPKAWLTGDYNARTSGAVHRAGAERVRVLWALASREVEAGVETGPERAKTTKSGEGNPAGPRSAR